MLFHRLVSNPHLLLFLLLVAVSATASPTPSDSQSIGQPRPRPDHGLPLCNEMYRPCRCPHGTTFKNLTTFGIVGAPAIDVQGVMGDWPLVVFDLTFQGLVPISVTGDGHVAGATRTFNFTVPDAGYYLFTEELVEWTALPDGSFNQKYRQGGNPPAVDVPGGGGGYYGMWHSVTGQQTAIANETAISWQNWRCDIGEPFRKLTCLILLDLEDAAATSHENGITRASEILNEMGLRTGVDIQSFTIFYEVRDD
ncbi:hypothetical protein BDV10DRAFT_187233 [Aspergillus recurvatus]